MNTYSIKELCGEHLMIIIKGEFPSYCLSRYSKILSLLFKFGHYIALCMKKRKVLPMTDNLKAIRDQLYSYYSNTYCSGNIHYDLLKEVSLTSKIREVDGIFVNEYILKSMFIIDKLLKGGFNQYQKESLDFFITKTITVYSIYLITNI